MCCRLFDTGYKPSGNEKRILDPTRLAVLYRYGAEKLPARRVSSKDDFDRRGKIPL